MKNKKGGKLSLTKETVTKLGDESMKDIKGGATAWTTIGSQVWSLGCRCTAGCTDGPICKYTEASQTCQTV